jgi:hypothetical protein
MLWKITICELFVSFDWLMKLSCMFMAIRVGEAARSKIHPPRDTSVEKITYAKNKRGYSMNPRFAATGKLHVITSTPKFAAVKSRILLIGHNPERMAAAVQALRESHHVQATSEYAEAIFAFTQQAFDAVVFIGEMADAARQFFRNILGLRDPELAIVEHSGTSFLLPYELREALSERKRQRNF